MFKDGVFLFGGKVMSLTTAPMPMLITIAYLTLFLCDVGPPLLLVFFEVQLESSRPHVD